MTRYIPTYINWEDGWILSYQPIFIAILFALLFLGGCAAQLQTARSFQKAAHAEKIESLGILLDGACDALLVTDVRDAMTARPNLRAGLPLVCPNSVGVLMGLVGEPPPQTIKLQIEMIPPAE